MIILENVGRGLGWGDDNAASPPPPPPPIHECMLWGSVCLAFFIIFIHLLPNNNITYIYFNI